MSQKRIGIIFLVIVGIIFFISAYFLTPSFESFKDPLTWRSLTEDRPILTPFLIIGLIVVEVVVAPIPGGFIPVVSGYLFGTILGTFYSWSGNVIGSIIGFFLARTFGRSLAVKLIKKEKLEFYDKFINNKTHLLWIMYLLPFFPIDVVSVSIGLSTYKFKYFFRMVVLGLFPGMLLLNYLGDSIYETGAASLFIILGFAVLIFILYSFKKEWKLSR